MCFDLKTPTTVINGVSHVLHWFFLCVLLMPNGRCSGINELFTSGISSWKHAICYVGIERSDTLLWYSRLLIHVLVLLTCM